ncbi:Putative TrmH family tRNA/rRNA methyltransferase [Jeotgalibaca dankookensis]|uniref:Putative TrmH family tRNA/rRNA methyltransferase n=1 Tax=Jeotgalibaca dankookensis TaxID=708126 RepID=A0A1S6IPF5_9LACT|nr:RNA methyltransferase [Jeotgalibaca dankookensis]AQS53340.1 Putative TrmH family tRNA/rRNA methyltransferase [Jeotgalibaca dankookensis]
MEKITSIKNQKIKQLKKLHTAKGRKEMGYYVIEGEHLYLEAVKSQVKLEEIIVTEKFLYKLKENHQEIATLVTDDVMNNLTQTETSQGIYCTVEIPDQDLPITYQGKYILLDGVQDPGNAGTIVRTADAAGFTGVIFGSGSVDPYNDKVVRSMQGSQFHLPIYRTNLLSVVEKFENVYGTALDPLAKDYRQVAKSKNIALVMGNEGNGVSTEILSKTTHNLYIPIYGQAESLNVAIAAGILIYHFV